LNIAVKTVLPLGVKSNCPLASKKNNYLCSLNLQHSEYKRG
jgi:hypothetical protein